MKVSWSRRWVLNKQLAKVKKKLRQYQELLYHLSNGVNLSDKLCEHNSGRFREVMTDIQKPMADLKKRKEKIESLLDVKQQAE